MRKIESEMLKAIETKTTWRNANTRVEYQCAVDTMTHARMEQAKVYLHGNHIATYLYDTKQAYRNHLTFQLWPTRTTKSRLRALNLSTK